jgi:transposase
MNNRRFLNGMLHVLRVGCPWRDYVRFRRWAEQGVWDAILETLVDLGLTDNWQHMRASMTMVRSLAITSTGPVLSTASSQMIRSACPNPLQSLLSWLDSPRLA